MVVDGGALGSFAQQLTLADLQQVEITVALRPTVGFLGMLGDDTVGAERLVEALESATTGGAWLMRPQQGGSELLGSPNDLFDVDLLRDLARTGAAATGLTVFDDLRQAAGVNGESSLYLFAVLSDDLVATHADLWAFPGGTAPAFGDRIRVALEEDDVAARIRDQALGAANDFLRASLAAELIDSPVSNGPTILSTVPGGAAAAAGLEPGDVLRSIAGSPAANATQVQQLVAASAPGATVDVSYLRGTTEITGTVTLGSSPEVVDPGSESIPFAGLSVLVELQLATGESQTPSWVLTLNRAASLMRASAWEDVVRLLRSAEVPQRDGVGAGMADYWLGVALAQLGDAYVTRSREAFDRAANDRSARLLHDDGPLIWPLARARAQSLQR